MADPYFQGALTGSGVSASFTGWLNTTFNMRAQFGPGAAGVVRLANAADGVNFRPIMAGAQVISAVPSTDYRTVFSSDNTPWRVEWAMTKGYASVSVYDGQHSSDPADTYGWIYGSFTRPGGSIKFADQPQGFILAADPGGSDASFTILQSTDDGATWNTYRTAAATSFYLLIEPGNTPSLWRLDCTMTTNGKTATWRQTIGNDARSGAINRNSFGGIVGMNPTPAQVMQQYEAKWTHLSDADLAGDLTLYKVCASNTFAKLTVPAAAQRCKGYDFIIGAHRSIRAEYADVISLVDANGNALQSAKSIMDSTTTYAPGSRTTARDFGSAGASPSLGAFTSNHYWAGIYAFPTLLEALGNDLSQSGPVPNLVALGL